MKQDGETCFIDNPNNPDKITEIIDTVKEAILPVMEVTDWCDKTLAFEIRREASISNTEYKRNKRLVPRFLCGICQQPVIFAALANKRFYVRHANSDGSCVKTRGGTYRPYANVRAHGESYKHKALKGHIKRSLEADGRFKNVQVEKGLTDLVTDERKRPDVSAWFHDKGIVFEAQVSNENYHKVFERVIFYRDLKNDGREWLTCWIFDEDVLSEENFIVFDDIYHQNNRNVFMVNHQTEKCSVKEKQFYLKCRWEEPVIDGDAIQIIKNERVVAFDELTLDFVGSRIFLFDFEDTKKRLERELQERLERERLEQKRLEQLERERLESTKKWLERKLQERLERERLEKTRQEQLERERQDREQKERLMNNIVYLLNERLQWLEKQKSQLTQKLPLIKPQFRHQLDEAVGIIEVRLVQLVMEPQLKDLLEKTRLAKERLQEELNRMWERMKPFKERLNIMNRRFQSLESSLILENMKQQQLEREQRERLEQERLMADELLFQKKLEMEWSHEKERLDRECKVTNEEGLDKSTSKNLYSKLPLVHKAIVCLFHQPSLSRNFLAKRYRFHSLISIKSVKKEDVWLLANMIFALGKLDKTVDAFCQHYVGTEYEDTLSRLSVINLRKNYTFDAKRTFIGILERSFNLTTS